MARVVLGVIGAPRSKGDASASNAAPNARIERIIPPNVRSVTRVYLPGSGGNWLYSLKGAFLPGELWARGENTALGPTTGTGNLTEFGGNLVRGQTQVEITKVHVPLAKATMPSKRDSNESSGFQARL